MELLFYLAICLGIGYFMGRILTGTALGIISIVAAVGLASLLPVSSGFAEFILEFYVVGGGIILATAWIVHSVESGDGRAIENFVKIFFK
jgi:hypothetical protein